MRKFLFIFLIAVMATVLFTTPEPVAPQEGSSAAESCPAIVETAFSTTQSVCEETGRNQACYGHFSLEAEAQPGYSIVQFSDAGDRVEVAAIQSLIAGPMDMDTGAWGVALMQIQANLPDVDPLQQVTFLLFGDVSLENRVPVVDPVTLTNSSNSLINVRQAPGTRYPVVAQIAPDESLQTDGRIEDGTWVRVRLPESGSTGWLFADLMDVEGDISALPVVDGLAPSLTPMQAVYFTSNADSGPACAEAPEDGMLVQTPEGEARIRLWINEVKVDIGSTAYLRMSPDGLNISLLEGLAFVEVDGEWVVVPAGAQTTVPLDENGLAAGAPAPPAPYDASLMPNLPIELLDYVFAMEGPLSQEEIDIIVSRYAPPPPAEEEEEEVEVEVEVTDDGDDDGGPPDCVPGNGPPDNANNENGNTPDFCD